MTSPSVEVRNVTKAFGRGPEAVRVLNDVSVTIREREFFTLLGPSGCGKTTLLRLIAGFEEANAGEIKISGAVVNHLPPFKRRVNTVFQSYALFPHLTVEQNVAFGLEMQDLSPADRGRRTMEALELVRMEHLAKRRPAQLSGGQQQRVALARALAPRPDVLLLDEPLSALDLKLRKEMQIELKQLQSDAGITFIFVTHDQEEALTMSDRIAVMQSGKILQIGAPIDIYERPQHRFVADFIGDSNFLTGPVSSDGCNGLQVDLDGAGFVPCPAPVTPGSNITLAIRPERALIVPTESSDRHLAAEIAQVVYLGTATLYQLRLGNGQTFSVRQGNVTGGRQALAIGSRVGITLPADALNVVEA